MLLSVLDQSPIVSGRTPAESIRETLALAAHCDALGYHRYWVSEHHNSPSAAGAAPEILVERVKLQRNAEARGDHAKVFAMINAG